jgi:hypothetical protein
MKTTIYSCDRCKKTSLDEASLGRCGNSLTLKAYIRGTSDEYINEYGMLCDECEASLKTLIKVLSGGLKLAMKQWFEGVK